MVGFRAGVVRFILPRSPHFWLQKRVGCTLEAEEVQVRTAFSCLPVCLKRMYYASNLVYPDFQSSF